MWVLCGCCYGCFCVVEIFEDVLVMFVEMLFFFGECYVLCCVIE